MNFYKHSPITSFFLAICPEIMKKLNRQIQKKHKLQKPKPISTLK